MVAQKYNTSFKYNHTFVFIFTEYSPIYIFWYKHTFHFFLLIYHPTHRISHSGKRFLNFHHNRFAFIRGWQLVAVRVREIFFCQKFEKFFQDELTLSIE